MSVRQAGDPVESAAVGHRLFEVHEALQCLLLGISVFEGTRVGCGVFGCHINSFVLAVAANILR